MDRNKYNILVGNLKTYLEVLIENYNCRGEKAPQSLLDLNKLLFELENGRLNDKTEKIQKIFGVSYTIATGVDLLETTDINTTELAALRTSILKDRDIFLKEEQKDIRDLLPQIEKAFEKAISKVPALQNNHFRVDEKNIIGMQGVKNQETMGKLPKYFDLYANVVTLTSEPHKTRGNVNTREQITFSEGLKKVFEYVKISLHTHYGPKTNFDEIEKEFSKTDEQKMLDNYHQMLGEGKIERVSKEEPLTFFAKVGFRPLKKQLTEREIIDKLAKTNYALDVLDEIIGVIETNQATQIFSQTLAQLTELRKKYSVVFNKLNEDLKNSDYEEIKNKVETQKEIERKKEIHQLKRDSFIARYDAILRTSDEELRKKYLKEIKEIDLPENEKEEIKHNVEYAYRIEKATKGMKEIKEEQVYDFTPEHELRKRAIEELDNSHEFERVYYEADLETRDSMMGVINGTLIKEKERELKKQDKRALQEQALQDLKNQGHVRQDATLETLISAERQSLEIQMRENARALEAQNNGHSR